MFRWPGLIFFLLISHSAWAIEAVISKTIFYAPQQGKFSPYIEISFQVDARTIHFYQTPDSQWQSKLQTDIVLKNELGIVREEHFVLQTPARPTYEAATAQTIIDLHRYSIPAGNTQMDIRFSEPGFEDKAMAYTDSFVVKQPGDSAFYSGIQLLDTVYNAGKGSNIFQKNGRMQVPFSSNFINENRSILRLYTELYQTNRIAKDQYPLVQKVSISRKPLGGPFLKLQNTDTIQPADVLPFIGQFDVSALPSGNYYLDAVLENKESEIIAGQSLFFQRSNPHPVIPKDTLTDTGTGMQKVNIVDLSTTFLGKYSFGQVRAILKMMLPISTPPEARTINAFLDKPDETYMRYYIYNYWKGRNEAEPKKAWDEYTAQVREVNKLFGYGTKPGYETERGSIYLKYGKPTERIIVENEQGSLPYEVWQYNSLPRQGGGGVLLFYRPANLISDLRLLHTTIRGEMRNTAWRQELYTDGVNPNARAEQYFTNR